MRKRIKVVPYGENLLRYLAQELLKAHFDPEDPLGLARVTVLFPHRRPALYLRHYLREAIGGPFLPPRIYAIEDFVDYLAVKMEDPPRRVLGIADQAWLLYQGIKQRGRFQRVSASFDQFFSWGVRLASLLEELYRELKEPPSVPYPEGVPEEARPLLEDLHEIWSDYEARLQAQGFTTPGRRFKEVASRVSDLELEGTPFWIVGFYALTASENRILKHLWEGGAEVLWQAQAEDLPPLYRRWKEDWRAELQEVKPRRETPTKVHLIEAYDLHSEVLRAKETIGKGGGPDAQALVLPDPAALIPLLHELPEGQEVNVTLGYPLERTTIFALIEQLMRLQEGQEPSRGYYHRDYLAVIRHPFIKRLPTPSGREGRIVLHLLEERIRERGRPYFHLEELKGLIDGRAEAFLASEGISLEEASLFIEEIHRRVVLPWRDVRTAGQLAGCLREVVRFVLDPFIGEEGQLERYPLENEFLYCLETQIIPALEGSLFRDEPIEQGLLFNLLRRLVALTRTPFEGQPLVGLQVLGLLETRLLSFERVVVLDLNEGTLPSHEDVDPLMPPSLRPAVGLPEREREEEIVWYHFERLLRSSAEAYLIWQSAVAPSEEGLESKTSRSRFVERILWEEEKRKGRTLEEEVERLPLTLPSSCFLASEGIEKDLGRVRAFLMARAQGEGISPSLLNTYLDCPLRFYYRYILGLARPVDVLEETDAGILGGVIHGAMEDYFRPFLRRTYHPVADRDPGRLIELFLRHLEGSRLGETLSPEKRFFVEEAAKFRLRKYLEGMKGPVWIEALERPFRLTLSLGGSEWTFYGKVDRIDRRGDLRVILDYKTGYVEPPGANAFLEKISALRPPAGLDYEGLRGLKRGIEDLQLHLYVLLVSQGREEELRRTTAAYVMLQEQGEEKFLLRPEKLRDGALQGLWVQWFRVGLPQILQYLLRHILEAPLYFRATDDGLCRSCDYEPSCHFAW